MNAIKRNYIVVSVIWILSSYACSNSIDKISDDQQDGIVPSSIEQVTDVFELKYGEIKECNYDGQLIKFSITNVEDSLQDCSVIDLGGDPDALNSIRIHALLRVEAGRDISQLKVSSQRCGGYFYRNDGADIQNVWDILDSIQSCYANQIDTSYFLSEFIRDFGAGALIVGTSLSIYMGKYYSPPNKTDKNNYKFIFIITENIK